MMVRKSYCWLAIAELWKEEFDGEVAEDEMAGGLLQRQAVEMRWCFALINS